MGRHRTLVVVSCVIEINNPACMRNNYDNSKSNKRTKQKEDFSTYRLLINAKANALARIANANDTDTLIYSR